MLDEVEICSYKLPINTIETHSVWREVHKEVAEIALHLD